jgi:threonine aldolase
MTKQTAPATSSEPAASEKPADALRARMRTCERRLSGSSGTKTVRESLQALADTAGSASAEAAAAYGLDEPTDVYGDGIVAKLEKRVAGLLGTEDAAYFPTGTMAQQAALRCWAAETGSELVATHPLAHLEVHENHAYRDLTGLRGVWPTSQPRNPTAEEVRESALRFGVISFELPLREAGFVLPTWDELVEASTAARDRGARVHFDGARLWESAGHFGRPLDEIAGLADSVYVSFYKSLGAVSGAAVGASASFVAALKVWRHRYGGRLYQQWPAVLSALIGLDGQLPKLPGYVAHAKAVAAALAEGGRNTPGVRVFPETPHTHQFRLYVPFDPDTVRRAGVEQIEHSGKGLFHFWAPAQPPGFAFTEVTVAEDAAGWSAAEITGAFADLLERAARGA